MITHGWSGDQSGVNSSKPKVGSLNPHQTMPYRNGGNKSLNSQSKPLVNRSSPIRRISEAEIREKKAKGLCFICDGRYHADHQCRYKELHVLIVKEDGSEYELEEDDDSEKEEDELDKEEQSPEAFELAELSTNLVVGLSSPRTLKRRGSIKEEDVVVLIDSGASHNFVSHHMVSKLGLSTEETQGYGVTMGTGMAVKGAGVCGKVELRMPNYTAIVSLLPLKLGNAYVILGIQWLETLGQVKTNWKEHRMSFKDSGTKVTLQGDPSLCNSPVSLKALRKALKDDGEGVLVEYGALQTEELGEEKQILSELQEGKTGAEPVSVRPFSKLSPYCNLEDKVGFNGAGNDTYEAKETYETVHPPILYHDKRKKGSQMA